VGARGTGAPVGFIIPAQIMLPATAQANQTVRGKTPRQLRA
jgi:hypothetical protein